MPKLDSVLQDIKMNSTSLTSQDDPLFILLFYWAQKLFGPFLFVLNIYYTYLHIWAQFHGLLLNNNFHSILFLSLFSLLSG